eukprot:6189303-Pleurochrysis_carterae.AAC.1
MHQNGCTPITTPKICKTAIGRNECHDPMQLLIRSKRFPWRTKQMCVLLIASSQSGKGCNSQGRQYPSLVDSDCTINEQ